MLFHHTAICTTVDTDRQRLASLDEHTASGTHTHTHANEIQTYSTTFSGVLCAVPFEMRLETVQSTKQLSTVIYPNRPRVYSLIATALWLIEPALQ